MDIAKDIKDFLMTRRARITSEQVGLPPGRRRRALGLSVVPWIHDAAISRRTPQWRLVYTRPPMRSRVSITRTCHPASVRLRAADKPAIPAPTTEDRLGVRWRGVIRRAGGC